MSEQTLGDFVLILLASTLAGLRDRLEGDGFHDQSAVVSELVDTLDNWLGRLGLVEVD